MAPFRNKMSHIKTISGCGKVIKMTPFRHKMSHIKTINLTEKYLLSC